MITICFKKLSSCLQSIAQGDRSADRRSNDRMGGARVGNFVTELDQSLRLNGGGLGEPILSDSA